MAKTTVKQPSVKNTKATPPPTPSQEVMAKADQAVSTNVHNWTAQSASAKDLLIPKILVMQGLSKLVAARKAQIGDLVESLNSEKLGTIDQAVEFIPFGIRPMWVHFAEDKPNSNNFKYKGQEDITPANDNLPYEEVINGVKVRRDRTLNFYCLRPSEIKDGMHFPYMLSFRRTSMMAGKKLNTAFVRLAAFNKPPAADVFELCGSMQSNEKGTYAVLDVRKKRESTPEEIAACFQWHQTISQSNVKIDDSDLQGETEETGTTQQEPQGPSQF